MSDAELIKQARAGVTTAFDRLLLDRYDAVSRYVEREMSAKWQGQIDVDDVLQETFACAFRTIHQFEGQTASELEGWLKSVARHRLLDMIRTLNRKKRGGDMQRVTGSSPTDDADDLLFDLVQTLRSDTDTPSQRVAKREAASAMREAIERLPSEQRKMIQLRYLDLLELAEISNITDRTVPAIRGLLHRAKRSLKDDLGHTTRWFS